MKYFATILVFVFITSQLVHAQTPGSMSLSVTTVPNGVDYSPKHVLAIWVEDENTDFVKTLKLRGDKRKGYLETWNSKSSGNTTDAITGSTLGSHESHSVSWDCSNTSGALVDDGSYSIRIEYTSEHDQGPITKIDFTKSATEFSFQPGNETYFTNMDLVYTPESTTQVIENTVSYALNTYPNPASGHLNIELSIPSERQVSIKVYQSDMKLINTIWDGEMSSGEHVLVWDTDQESGKKVSAGTYFVVVSGTNLYSSRQIVVQ